MMVILDIAKWKLVEYSFEVSVTSLSINFVLVHSIISISPQLGQFDVPSHISVPNIQNAGHKGALLTKLPFISFAIGSLPVNSTDILVLFPILNQELCFALLISKTYNK